MNFVDIYQKYWKNGYTLTDLSLSGIDREVFRSLFNPVAEVFRKYPAGDVHLYIPGVGQVQGLQPGNYFDSAGSTQASVDGSVGLVLDAAGSVGPELSNLYEQTLTGTLYGNAVPNPAVGKLYKITATVNKVSGSSIGIGITKSDFGWHPGQTQIITANGVSYVSFYAKASEAYVVPAVIFASSTGTVTFTSCKEITGIHATQSTPGYKPTLRKGIVNLLTWSNDLTNAAWAVANGASKSGQTLTLSNNFGSKVQQFSGAIVLGGTCTAAFALSGTPGVRVQIGVMDNGGAFPQSNTQVTLTATPTLYAITRPATTQAQVIPYIQDYGSATTVTVGACGLFAGTITAAQILAAGGIPLTTTAPASSQAGVNYLEFVDTNQQCLKRPPASVGASGWAVVAVAASKLANMSPMGSLGTTNEVGQAGYAFKLRATGAIWLRIGDGSGVQGNIREVLTGSNAYQIGQPIVMSMRWISGGSLFARVNGVDIGSVVCVNPSGTNVGVAIGAHSPLSAEYFSGKIFFNQDGVGAISVQDIAIIEKQAASLAGIQL